MKTLALAMALTASLITGSAIAAESPSSPESAASMPSQSHASTHARHEAHMRRTLSKKQCADMPGDEKKDCQKNAGRDAYAAHKEAMSAAAGAGK